MTSTEDERLADLFGKQAAHSEHSRGAKWTGGASTSTTSCSATGRVTRFLISCFWWTFSNNPPAHCAPQKQKEEWDVRG